MPISVQPFLLALTLSASSVMITACRGREHASDNPYADRVAQAVPALERTTGLKFKTPPRVEARSKAQVREFVMQQLTSQHAQRQLAGVEAAYRQLGLIPDTLQLRPMLVDLLQEQIVGYYDPGTKVLYVVEGAEPEAVGITLTHELVHALQDQYIDLDSIQRSEGDNDRLSAAQSVLEGQAVFEQLAAMLGSRSAAVNLPGGWDRVRELIRENRSAMPIFSNAPLIIQETLIFPYLSGAEFVRTFKDRRRGQVPFGDMATSTEQILHPSAYFTKRDDPTTIHITPLKNAKVVYENTLGEFETRLFLYQHLQNQNDAVRGAAGWDGDRYMVVDVPQGRGIVWATVWDSAVDAAEFRDLLLQTIKSRGRNASRMTAVTGGEVQGRSTVLFTDLPAGATANPVTLSAVRID